MQKDIINWSELSTLLSGNRGAVRKNHIPKKYKAKINKLISYIEAWEKDLSITTEKEFNDRLKEINLFKLVVEGNEK